MSNKDRNYMRVGTIFEKDGTIYVVREANANTCAGCTFYGITSEGKNRNVKGYLYPVTGIIGRTERT